MNLLEELIKLRNILTRTKQDETDNSRKCIVAKTELNEDDIRLLSNVREFNEEKVSSAAEAIANHFKRLAEPNLDNKVNNFIDWVINIRLKNEQSESYKYKEPKRIRNFIEKMAIWYELRYPLYEINRLMRCCGTEDKKINDIMFKNNTYKQANFNNSDSKEIDWSQLYNKDVFIKSLPWEESRYLEEPTYMRLVYIEPSNNSHFHLSPEGIIIESEGLSIVTNGKIKDKDVISKHIKDISLMFEQANIILPNNEIKNVIDLYEQREYFREELLNCVMYRIIERGDSRIGPRRAFLFAKEFDRSIDIPMMYAYDFADGYLRNFINIYIKNGGRTDLECYKDYFSKTKDYQKLNTITIGEILKKSSNELTEEEIELHQRLINILNTQIDLNALKKEKVKQLRIERKIRRYKAKY